MIKSFILKLKYIIYICLVSMICANSFTQTNEYLVKAAFIKKFTLFIEWPLNANKQDFVISIFGENPFLGDVNSFFKDSKINNKKIILKYTNDISELGETDILFLSESEKKSLKNTIQKYKGKSVLIISDTPGHAKQGAHISFYLRNNNKIHFEINKEAFAESELKIDLKLLSYAKIVDPKK